jgi:hypothetical protein
MIVCCLYLTASHEKVSAMFHAYRRRNIAVGGRQLIGPVRQTDGQSEVVAWLVTAVGATGVALLVGAFTG